MLGLHQYESFGYSAIPEALFHMGGNVNECPACGCSKPEFFAIRFHGASLLGMIFTLSLTLSTTQRTWVIHYGVRVF